jgi:hypothetical protein
LKVDDGIAKTKNCDEDEQASLALNDRVRTKISADGGPPAGHRQPHKPGYCDMIQEGPGAVQKALVAVHSAFSPADQVQNQQRTFPHQDHLELQVVMVSVMV